MSDEESKDKLDFATVQSTYKIITTLLEHVDSSSSLISLMASLLGEETTRKVTQTAAWADYLQSRKTLEKLRPELERFAATAIDLVNKEPE